MARKRVLKKTNKKELKKEMQKHWDLFQNQCMEYETRMNSICSDTCDKVRKMYTDKLKSLPENVRNMTIAEYMEYTSKIEADEAECQQSLRSEFEKTKLMSEKKKTLKKTLKREERKRSLSVSILNSSKVSCQPSLLSRASRVLSDSNLSTPLSKRSVAPTFAVTPKFNHRVPMNKSHLRRPRVGETVMSLSGSPLQNFVEDIPDRPGYAVSLGGGKIIKITEDTDISKLEGDFMKKIDLSTKQALENARKILDEYLKP